MSEGKKSIADLVKELQEKKSVTLEQVYESIGMKKQTFFNRMRAEKFLAHEAAALAKYFEVDFEKYFGGYYDQALVVGEPRAEYFSAKEELVLCYRKLDRLHDDLEEALKREIKLVKALAKAGATIPD